jgi:hypothetical protein
MEVDKEQRAKRFKERQHSLNERLSKQLSTLKSDFVFSKTKTKNRLESVIASRFERQMRAKEEQRHKRLMKKRDLFGAKDSKESESLKVIDLLKNSTHLSKGMVVKDMLTYGCDPKRIDPSIALPKRTIESYY